MNNLLKTSAKQENTFSFKFVILHEFGMLQFHEDGNPS
jgi:hypothetical protein